ncbi:hypothetical protein TrVE_jg10761 [Triparma verrucosa]|uniref:Amidohydrolase-related domain-containing protein n=1 Tax=Triparma verrucosa TaxID=1606542 RepID=A0A9W7EWW4_9STRA|nr:hypothetical protein TrVE_jg10761 [Triparma verrucosa]
MVGLKLVLIVILITCYLPQSSPLGITLDTHYHLSPPSTPLPPSATVTEYDAFTSSLKVTKSVCTQPAALYANHDYLLTHASDNRKAVGLFTPPPSTKVYDSDNPNTHTSIHSIDTFTNLQSSSPSLLGVRLNPSLFPSEDSSLPLSSNPDLLRLYKHLSTISYTGPTLKHFNDRSELVGRAGVASLLCMSGFNTVEEDVLRLLDVSPDTPLVIDHFGFTRIGTKEGDEDFQRLISLLQDSRSLYVRASAGFRVVGDGDLGRVGRERLGPCLESKRERVLWGTDWPFCGEEGGKEWKDISERMGVEDRWGEELYGFLTVDEKQL